MALCDCFATYLPIQIVARTGQIIDVFKERPLNLDKLSEILGLDYNGVQHHVSVLEKNLFNKNR